MKSWERAAAGSCGSSQARVAGVGSESNPLSFVLTGDTDFIEGRLILEKTAKQSKRMCSGLEL